MQLIPINYNYKTNVSFQAKQDSTQTILVKDVEEYLKQGWSYRRIAEKYGCSAAKVIKIAKDNNLDNYRKKIEYKNKIENTSVDEIRKQLAKGATIRYLAKIYESSNIAIRNFLAKHGLATKESTRIANVTREQLEELLSQGKTQSDIAKYFGVNPGTITGLFQKYKIKSSEVVVLENTSKEALVQLLEKYGSIKKVAQHFNVSVHFVNKLFYELGIKDKSKTKMQTKPVISAEELKRFVENGATMKDLRERYGLGEISIQNLLKKNNLILSNSKKSRDLLKAKQRRDIKDLVAQRKSESEIAKELGISRDVLSERLKELQIATLEKTKSLTSVKMLKNLAQRGMSIDEIAKELNEDSKVLENIIEVSSIQILHPEKFTCINPWDEQWLFKTLIKRGSSAVQIAELYGVSSDTAKTWLKSLKIPVPEDKLSPTKEEFKSLLESMIEQRVHKNVPVEWAKETGFSRYTIQYLADRYGYDTLLYLAEHKI